MNNTTLTIRLLVNDTNIYENNDEHKIITDIQKWNKTIRKLFNNRDKA